MFYFLCKRTCLKKDELLKRSDTGMTVLSDAYISDVLESWKYFKLLVSKNVLVKFSTLGFASYEDVETIKIMLM